MRRRIMVVEDDAAVLEAVQIMLGNRYDVITATNGEEAVRLYRIFKPELVLMDIAMPVMDGVEATKEILKFDPEAKIIGISAYIRRRGQELLDAGAKEVIEKPFTRKKLIETVEKYLG
ncbi:response regulator [Archaeoglobus neptunius]|uniref:response regulator n=1 Tax=Archaeoglobus neptunius TaxID=2798580 RepID=UPI001E48DF7F|nr:response regulator [Archaeoglobus neptunius]